MDWLPSVVDPTTVCVGLLILALTLVWAYVMLGGSTKQPDLSVLYEKEAGAGKRTGKTRSKGKQVGWLCLDRLLSMFECATDGYLNRDQLTLAHGAKRSQSDVGGIN